MFGSFVPTHRYQPPKIHQIHATLKKVRKCFGSVPKSRPVLSHNLSSIQVLWESTQLFLWNRADKPIKRRNLITPLGRSNQRVLAVWSFSIFETWLSSFQNGAHPSSLCVCVRWRVIHWQQSKNEGFFYLT